MKRLRKGLAFVLCAIMQQKIEYSQFSQKTEKGVLFYDEEALKKIC